MARKAMRSIDALSMRIVRKPRYVTQEKQSMKSGCWLIDSRWTASDGVDKSFPPKDCAAQWREEDLQVGANYWY